VISIGDYLFTQEQRSDREAVVCYRADSGEEVWVHSPKDSAERFEDSLSGVGPRATPTFHRGRIYAYGATGTLECLDATTGVAYWSQSLFALVGVKTPQWGSATSPIIVDDKVVVFTGGQQDNSLLALDLLTGKVCWQAAGGPTSYSTPQVMTIVGETLILMHDDEGLNGVRIDDGKLLFKYRSPHAASFQPMLQPHVVGEDRLIVNWDSGLLCLQIQRGTEAWKLQEHWTSNRLKPSFNEFAIHKGHIYGFDDGIFCCVDVANGKRQWKAGRYGYGQLLLLPEINELIVITEQGDVVRIAAEPKNHRELGRFKSVEGKTWNHPLLVRGRLIVRNAEEMACFDVGKPATHLAERPSSVHSQ
jgi:outer membrane protein assembly factor BamB